MKSVNLILGAFLLAISGSAGAQDGLRVVDLTGKFDRFVMATRDMPDAERIAAFEQQIGPIANGFYSRRRGPHGYDYRVLVQLKTYPQRRTAILAVSRDFNRQFTPARRKFESVFGQVASPRPAFLIDSMGELDGGMRELDGNQTLLFGADVIAEIHGGQSLTAFFYHELFHLYHEKQEGICGTVWCALWSEGLATYVSSRLAPGASDSELVLDEPGPIRPAVEADRGRAVCAVARRLESTTDDDFGALFLADDNLPGLPPRLGYYIGYLVAADIGRTRNLHQLAAMDMMEVRPLIDASLARMATCPSRVTEAHDSSRTNRARGFHQPAGRLAAVSRYADHRARHEVRLGRPS